MVSKVICVFISVKIAINEGIIVGLFEKGAVGTHPAALRARPSLRLRRKEGYLLGLPSLSLAKERVDKRSDVGVSYIQYSPLNLTLAFQFITAGL